MKIKICGITTLEDALLATELGADLLGLNFYPPSPRSISPDVAGRLTQELRHRCPEGCPLLVGVFVNASVAEVERVLVEAQLDAAQLSGDEEPATLAALQGRAFKAIRPRSLDDVAEMVQRFLPVASRSDAIPDLLADAYHHADYGGTGRTVAGEVVAAITGQTHRLMLAGGLTPANVYDAITRHQPWGVDVASGVEANIPGRKDPERLSAFIHEARRAEARVQGA
jgi:phosphoribosylanthranilate isomerase